MDDLSNNATAAGGAPRAVRRRFPGSHHWRREAVELAALFVAVATADLVANVVVHGHDGPALLVVSAAALLVTTVCQMRWSHRRGHAPPGPDPAGRGALGTPAGQAEPAGEGEAEAGGPLPGEGRDLWRIRTTVQDAPGSLAALCGALAGLRVNILSLQTHPLTDGAVDEFLVQSPAGLSRSALAAAVVSAGGRDTWIDRADAHDLVDVPTRILGLATRTALDAAELPVALRQLFGPCTIRSLPSGCRPSASEPAASQPCASEPSASQPAGQEGSGTVDGTVMRLRDPGGCVLEISRPQLPFTPTEFARARALVELDALLGPRVPDVRDVLTLADGRQEITVRRADPGDREAAREMHARCSATTLRRRYHGPVADADRYLDHLLEPRHGQTLAVEAPDGRIVALAHLLWDGDSAEVALLVEDAWQRRGLGLDLLRRMAALAAEAGVETVYAVTEASNTAMVAAMRRLEVPLDYQMEDGTLVVTAHLADAADRLPSPWPAEPRP